MGCNDEYDTCGESSKVPAKCVPYFGIVSAESSLTDDRCKNMHKVAEDIYEQLDTLFDKVSLEGLTSDCVELGLTPTIASVFQQVLDYMCTLNPTSSPCYGGASTDPCSGEVLTPNGLVYHSFANGSLPITSSSTWNYGTPSDLYQLNMTTKVSTKGTYKISVEVEVPITGSNEILVGISKNNVAPNQDLSTLDGNFSVRRLNVNTTKTFNFVKELEANDVIKVGFKAVVGTPTVAAAIITVEKVA